MCFIPLDLRLFFQELSFGQEIPHVLGYLPKLSLSDGRARDENNMSIGIDLAQIAAICLPKPPAQAIAHYAVTHLFAYRKADAHTAVPAGQIHQHKAPGGK